MPTDVSLLPLDPADKPVRAAATRKTKCVRCKEADSVLVIQTSKYCTPCFHFVFHGKVNMVMEQSRICAYIQRMEQEAVEGESSRAGTGGRVALGFSGGPNSRAMLRLARQRLLPPLGYDSSRGRAHEISAIDVVYVEDCALIDGDAKDRIEEMAAIVEEEGGERAGLHFVPLRLEDVYEDGEVECSAGFKQPRVLDQGAMRVNAVQALRDLFAALRPNNTPRTALGNARSRTEDMQRLLTMHLLRREARRRNASCLLTGENATRRAIRSIEGLARGQGFRMPLEEAPFRWHDVFMLRPMADVGAKEVAFYLRSMNISHPVPRDPIALELLDAEQHDNGNKASIGRLTESLIHLLEANVPSTASTVNRTAAKLVFHQEEASHEAVNDEEEEEVGSFQRVGPSVRLRRREASQAIGEVEKSVRGLGLGGLGGKLFITAQSWPRYDGKDACPLCELPVQRGLQAWREGLTVCKPAPLQTCPDSSLNLSPLLCYACDLVLDTPEVARANSKMPLPKFVQEIAALRAVN